MYSKNLQIKNNNLYIGKYNLVDVATEFGTPLYVFDEDDIIKKIRLYIDSFSSNHFHSEIVYASKAFLVPAMVKLLLKADLYMDVMSITDMEIARLANCPFQKMIFHGNNKSNDELNYAVENEVGLIVVDNYNELERLIKITKEKRKVISTLFRVNPKIDAHTHQYIQTAKTASKFGEDIDDERTIDKIMKLYLNNSYVQLLGFHAHIGSQIKELEPYELLVKKLLTFSKEISIKYKIELENINFGGGFGISYFENDTEFDLEKAIIDLKKIIEVNMKDLGYHIPTVMIEPGRSIIGPAGLTIYECGIIKKTLKKKNFLFINGGMTDNIRPALYQAKYHALVVNKASEKPTIKVDVVGKCCESGDFIIKNEMIPLTNSGDYLAVFATGAYNYSMNVQYNGQLKPAVVFIGNNEVRLVSKRQEIINIKELF